MLELLAAAGKTAPYPTGCPFINEIIAVVLTWVAG